MTREERIKIVRDGVKAHIKKAAKKWDGELTLDIAPQAYLGAREFFKNSQIERMDIDPSNGDIIHDICKPYEEINNLYSCIICTEVLEHTKQPFNAAKNLTDWLIPGGELYVTTPFDFFLHYNPIDCWRFTEQGLRELFKGYEMEITHIGDDDMPIQYQCIIRK